ncbi:glycosyl hydrolase family 18 protein [Paenibacillus sp.]|uniref:glycosyl hydrolase family 18 protein n=1 Tax=Paenibacillus sp. TaxID=58172 RepID=UPI002D436AF0|nr:glycosyl hydrolase family 18 protein [Paenibacillus sp.]HZG85509.1 glycosyl hydrolase family 18 protein [Paenibacillus sp.]
MRKRAIAAALACLLALPGITGQAPRAAADHTYNMSYIYFGSPSTYARQVERTGKTLSAVSPNYFDIKEDGLLDVTWKLSSSFIDQMHAKGMKVVPFLSNHWQKQPGIAAMANREKLAGQIAEAVRKYGLDGVNVDIEGVSSDYRDEFTDFIRLLRRALPEGAELSVAVAANPNGWKTGWHGFYDYAALAPNADYLMIMAYDESWEGSEPGPVASLGFVDRSIRYALKQGIPKSKIVVGLNFYGRIWKTDSAANSEGRVIRGLGISNVRVPPLLEKYKGQVTYDEASQSPRAVIRIPAGAVEYVGETKLTAGTYTIWFENERSLKAKLRLVSEHGIKGSGSWSLNQETKDVWDYYALWVNGTYFTDVGRGFWAESEILAMTEKGWMQGVGATKFAPQGSLTRAQAAVILVRALGLQEETPSSKAFADVPARHWAKKEIELAREYGFLEGVAPGRFAPDAPITREQLAAMLARIFELAPDAESEAAAAAFADVAPGAYYYDAVRAMRQYDIINGVEQGVFGVGRKSTRAEMSVLMNRLRERIEAWNGARAANT